MLIQQATLTPNYYPQAYALFCSHRERPWSYELFVASIEKSHAFFAFENDVLIAYAICTCVLGEGELEDICVNKTLRCKGVAHALIAHIASISASLNMDYLLLEVNQHNSAAIALYEKSGFKQVGMRKHYYEHNNGTYSDALVLQKML